MILNQQKFLNEFELHALLETLNKFRNKDIRNVTLLELALSTGARATELLNVTRLDLNHDDKSVLIKGLKGSNDREIPVKKELFQQLVNLGLENEKLFPISYKRFYQIWSLYKPTKKKLHAIRHTYAVNLYKKTKDIKLVQHALGHRSQLSTNIYLTYQYGVDELRKAMFG